MVQAYKWEIGKLLTHMHTKPQKVKAILVDLDGTLVDSLPVLYPIYGEFLRLYGFEGSSCEFEQINGYSVPLIVEFLQKKYDLPGFAQDLYTKYESLIQERYLDCVELFPDSKSFLSRGTSLGYHFVLVSSCPEHLVRLILSKHEILPFFSHLITKDQVRFCKPHKEPYCLALDLLKIENTQAIAIEDAENGVLSAQGAGIMTFQIVRQGFAEKKDMAWPVVTQFQEILSWLEGAVLLRN